MNLKACKWAARTPEELVEALQDVHSLTLADINRFIEEALIYAVDYFTAPEEENMMFFIEDFDGDNSAAGKKAS